MIITTLDLGQSHPWALPVVGQEVGLIQTEGFEYSVWPRGSIVRQQNVTFKLAAWQGLGGAAALSRQATLYLLKQVEELASNAALQPLYIQWNATAQPGAPLNASELHDGWYVINYFSPLYQRYVVGGVVDCGLVVTQVAPAAPRAVALVYTGGALSSNYAGAAVNLIALPVGSTAGEAIFNRPLAEGNVPAVLAPAASFEPVFLSTNLAQIFQGGVHVYDTINTGSNPVPVAGGVFVNTAWVEVFYSDHDFVGDCVITNGALLLLFQTGQAMICNAYLWNTALASANWQLATSLVCRDNAPIGATLRNYTLQRVGAEECSVVCTSNTTGGNALSHRIRLQRGRYEARVDAIPLTQAATGSDSLVLGVAVAMKIGYSNSGVTDWITGTSTVAVDATYGYDAYFGVNSSFPFIVGFLYQNQPGGGQPFANASGNPILGDTTSLAINAQRAYGFFVIPYGVSGSYSTANLQSEGESGALGTGWSSVADGAASGGNTAKCVSGTVATNADLFGTAFAPLGGVYDVWFRVKVTTNVGSALEMTLGLWDTTSSIFVPSGSTTFNRTAMSTSYIWVQAAANVTPTAAHNMQFRAVTALTLGTDWFVDEAVLLLHTASGNHRGPQDLWQQWLSKFSTRWVRP